MYWRSEKIVYKMNASAVADLAKLGIKPIVVVPIGNACIPDEIRNNQLSLVVIKYMKDHPDKLTTHAALLAIAAIKTEWECQ
jgi:hypothetical protein